MFYHYFLINQLPIVNDITKYINVLIVKNTEYPLVIDENFSNHNLIHYDNLYNRLIDHVFHITLYIKDCKIETLKVYNPKRHSVLNLQKSHIKDIFIRQSLNVSSLFDNNQTIDNFNIRNGWYISRVPITLYYSLL
jgi:hypothetical protein